MHPAQLKISDFWYPLPEERIAKYPLQERDQSKLLIHKAGEINHDIYQNISRYIPSESLLVFNNTKVIQARLLFRNENGARIEVFCLEPEGEISKAMSTCGSVRWHCLVGKASKWKQKRLTLAMPGLELTAEIMERSATDFLIEFKWTPNHLTFAELLNAVGVLPIPPYLKRETEEIDLDRYQTVYAKIHGSVAAPTAGLHFTDCVFDSLRKKNIVCDEVTLHVGAGTFMPVKSDTMLNHDMHEEQLHVSIALLQNLIRQKELDKPIIAVGTTSLRTLESLYWMGAKVEAQRNLHPDDIAVKQWDAYEVKPAHSALVALQNLAKWMNVNGMEEIICKTQILIAPPYELKIADALVTNFHQPNSTLLLLVAAVVGKEWSKIYSYALEKEFRFLSYGDGSLLWKT